MSNRTISSTAIRTRIFQFGEDLRAFLLEHLTKEQLEGNALALTTKLVSIAENRRTQRTSIDKRSLISKEADCYLTEGQYGVELTITKGLLIPSAGIDESNSQNDEYILYPQDPYASAKSLHGFLKNHFSLRNFALVLTDSHSAPLRRGVNGIALAHWGFRATKSLVGETDIFSKPLKFTHVNVADALASMAVFCMGEGSERTPLAIISGAEIDFTEHTDKAEVQIEPENDLYYPLLKPWMKK